MLEAFILVFFITLFISCFTILPDMIYYDLNDGKVHFTDYKKRELTKSIRYKCVITFISFIVTLSIIKTFIY